MLAMKIVLTNVVVVVMVMVVGVNKTYKKKKD